MPLVHETHGVFVYRVVHGRKVACRTVPHVGEEHAFGDGRWTLSGGDMVAVDCVQPSLVGSNNGPFLRLTNGRGWVFERKYGEEVMEPIPVERGLWPYLVRAPTRGLRPRAQPTTRSEAEDSDVFLYEDDDVVYPHGYVVWADVRVVDATASPPVTFVRVQGTTGWLFTLATDGDDAQLVPVGPSGDFNPRYQRQPLEVENGDRLDLSAVRAAATKRGLTETSHSLVARRVSFVKSLKDAGGAARGEAHVDVFFGTATVATRVQHPRLGKTQTFRRLCTMRDVERVFADPRNERVTGGGGGYRYRRRPFDVEDEAAAAAAEAATSGAMFAKLGIATRPTTKPSATLGSTGGGLLLPTPKGGGGGFGTLGTGMETLSLSLASSTSPLGSPSTNRAAPKTTDDDAWTPHDEEGSLRGELRELDAAIARLMTQRAILSSHLLDVETSSRERAQIDAMVDESETGFSASAAEASRTKRRGDPRTARGRGHVRVLSDVNDADDDFNRKCGGTDQFADVKFVSLFGEGDGWFIARDGGHSSWCGLPESLADRLWEAGRGDDDMRYAVCGPSGEYYCELPDGQKWCHDGAGDRFTSLIGKGTRKKTISRVAFGENDAWIVIFTNGACEWNGPVPEALVAAVRATDEAPTEVSLGSYGTFFVAFADGTYDHDLPDACGQCVYDLEEEGMTVTCVQLAPVDSEAGWLVRYSDGEEVVDVTRDAQGRPLDHLGRPKWVVIADRSAATNTLARVNKDPLPGSLLGAKVG